MTTPLLVFVFAYVLGWFKPFASYEYPIQHQFIVAVCSIMMSIVGGWLVWPAMILSGHCIGYKFRQYVEILNQDRLTKRGENQ